MCHHLFRTIDCKNSQVVANNLDALPGQPLLMDVTARGPVYGYEKHITGLERHLNRLVNTRFLPFKSSFCQVSAPHKRAF